MVIRELEGGPPKFRLRLEQKFTLYEHGMEDKIRNRIELIAGIDLEYMRRKKLCQRAIKSVTNEIEEYFSDINVECIHYIKARIKERNSIVDKAIRKKLKNPIYELKDIAGIRIVCHNESDVEQVAAFIKLRYKGRIIENEQLNREDGYKARHIVISINVLEAGQPKDVKVEIQLRTVAQDLFGTLSRRDVYKLNTKLPEDWLLKMKKLSEKLGEADKLAEELKQTWIEENIKTKAKDQLTAQTIMRLCSKEVNAKLTLDEALNCLANLVRHDINKISDLEAILKNKEIAIEIDKIYDELLGRKADVCGKIIYGSLLYKFNGGSDDIKSEVIKIIKDSIEDSIEYLRKKLWTTSKKVKFVKIN